jgi:uncharacterized protein (TIGR02147 family)
LIRFGPIAILRGVIAAKTNYRTWLKDEFAQRCQRNPRYSLRSFARDLRILPSRLSDIFNGKQGMSVGVARRLAERLGWDAPEQEFFAALVESEHARSQTKRELARRKVADGNYQTLDHDTFALISDWYHFAILELVFTEGFRPQLKWIARRLAITEIEVEQAVERLVNLGLLIRHGEHWEVTQKFPATMSGVPSKAIKKFHAQIMKKAADALYLQEIERRDFSTISVAINPDDLPEIKEEIKKFRRALEQKYKARANKREVYALSMQLFSLTEATAKPISAEGENKKTLTDVELT